jgi:hypothetical protein
MLKRRIAVVYIFIFVLTTFGAIANAAPELASTADPTSSAVLINGKPIGFVAYNINGSNYFKLRDLAYALNGTEKQFGVGWDDAGDAIKLTRGAPYIPVGGEMSGKGAEAGRMDAVPTTSKIYLDGNETLFTAFNIGGSNYFKLRDIGAAFDFGIGWDEALDSIAIDTGKSYDAASAPTPAILTASGARGIVRAWLDDHPDMIGFDLNEYSQDMFTHDGEEYFRFYNDYRYWLDFMVHSKTGELMCRQTEDGMDPHPPVFEPLDDYYDKIFGD